MFIASFGRLNFLFNQVNCDLHRCEITSREYCNFMKGYFHEEATLCSQVSKDFINLDLIHSVDLSRAAH